MSDVLETKALLSGNIQTIRDMLEEQCELMAAQPRSAVATRQLNYILAKMDQWLANFGPKPEPDTNPPDRQEIDEVLTKYREEGYAGLSAREKFVIEWFDREYRQRLPLSVQREALRRAA